MPQMEPPILRICSLVWLCFCIIHLLGANWPPRS
uniref:Uncharacterized protein n=1 Tax=Arundo donax TaxID=35708 RepID=A0A0A9G912_ARUDO